jgi:hypothetical protein
MDTQGEIPSLRIEMFVIAVDLVEPFDTTISSTHVMFAVFRAFAGMNLAAIGAAPAIGLFVGVSDVLLESPQVGRTGIEFRYFP